MAQPAALDTLRVGGGTRAATGRPAVLIFDRGGWCPYCSAHLGDVQKAEKELVELGVKPEF